MLNSEKETHLNLFMFMELWQLHIEEFEDTKGVIRIRKSKKNRQYNGQKKRDKRTKRSTKHTSKTTDRVARTPLSTQVLRKGGQFLLH